MPNLVEVFLPNGWSCKVNPKDVPEYLAKGFLRQLPKKEESEPDVEPAHVVAVEEVKEVREAAPAPVASVVPPERKRGRKV